MTQPSGKASSTLFIFLLLFYGLWFSGQLYSKDEVLRASLTASLARKASLWFDQEVYGEKFCRYPIGQSLAGIPFFFLDRWLYSLGAKELKDITLLPLTNAVISALVGLFLFRLLLLLGLSRTNSLIFTLAFALCSLLLPYSRNFLSEPLVCLSLLAAFYYLLLAAASYPSDYPLRAHKKIKYFLLSGIFIAVGVLTQLAVVLFLPLYVAFLLGTTWRSRFAGISSSLPQSGKAALSTPSFRLRWIHWLVFLVPVVIALAIDGWVNYQLWGSPFKTGYEKEGFTTGFFTGAYGLLLSVGRGLLIYCPWVVASILCLPHFYRRYREISLFCLTLFVLYLCLYARFWTWHGGWTPGSRFLIPTLPFLFLPLMTLVENKSARPGVVKSLAVILLIASFIIQLMMTLVNPLDYNNDLFGLVGQRENEFLFIPQVSSLWGLWQLILDNRFDPYVFKLFSPLKWPGLIIYGLIICGVFYLSSRLWRYSGIRFSLTGVLQNVKTCIGHYPLTVLLLVGLIFLAVLAGALTGPRGLIYSFKTGEDLTYGVDKRLRLSIKPEQAVSWRHWRGFLETPVSGHYWLYLKVKGRYRFMVDDQILFFNDQEIPQHLPQKKIFYEKGVHSIAIDYSPYQGEEGIFFLYWTVPGEGTYIQPVSSGYLYPSLPGQAARFFTLLSRQLRWFGLFLLLPLFLLEATLRHKEIEQT